LKIRVSRKRPDEYRESNEEQLCLFVTFVWLRETKKQHQGINEHNKYDKK